MPYLVNNNQFTAQNATVNPTNANPAGSYQDRAFGTKCVMAPNIDRIVLGMGDDENSTYTSSWWHYDIDNREFTRTRPDPGNALGFGAFATSTSLYQDYFGVARGDNRQLCYHPPSGTVYEWGGNAGANVSPNEQDPTWYAHFNGAQPPGGPYIYDPTTHLLTMPAGSGQSDNSSQYMSAAQGWDPDLNLFLQVMGESQSGGFDPVQGCKIYAFNAAGFKFLYHQWTPNGTTLPFATTNIGHQFTYHTRARKWILFGGNTTISGPPPYAVSGQTWLYDAPAKRWTRLADGPEARAFGFLTYDTQNNVCILTAGNGAGQGSFVTTTWAYSLEQNKWTNLNVNFARFWGGAVYDPTRNLHLYTPGTGASDRDVYTFRYAIPRASASSLVTGRWVAIPNGTTFTGNEVNPPSDVKWEKHGSCAYSPLTGRVYQHGGDTILPSQGVNGAQIGSSSYYQRTFSKDYGLRFASPSDINAGYRQEHGYCVIDGTEVMPKHADFYPFTWDPKRNVFWVCPGENFNSSSALENCTGETPNTSEGDPQYAHSLLLQFNPLTQRFSVYDPLVGGGITDTSNDRPWWSEYEPILDVLIRLEHVSSPFQEDRYTIGSPGTWSYSSIPVSGGSVGPHKHRWGIDLQRQKIYIADRQYGTFSVYDYLAKTCTVLGQLPGNAAYPDPHSSRVTDGGICCLDYNAGKIVYVELGASLVGYPAPIRVWTLDRDFTGPYSPSLWTQIDTNAKIMIDGTGVGALVPTCGPGQIAFDPDNNLVALYGDASGGNPTVTWAIRLSDMGTPAPPTINPVPDLVSINPATCVQGQTVAVTCFGFGASFVPTSVVQWDGVAQPTTFVNADTLTFTVTSTLSGVLGPHNVTVFNPTPGGGTSLATIFTVTSISNPLPSLNTLTPSSTIFNSGTLCTITGTGFIATSVINWDGAAQPTTFLSATQVAFSVTGPLASVLGAHSVTVTNPAPGGGTSNSLTFTVLDITPSTQTGIFVGSIM